MPADPQMSPSNSDQEPAPPKVITPSERDEKLAASGENAATPAASELTPEEQMERFEKELKETDWGHQPC